MRATIPSIVEKHRKKGNTTFLLKAALANPEVTLIYRLTDIAKEMEKKYWEMYKEHYNPLVRAYHRLIGRKSPIFISVSNFWINAVCDETTKRPAVFDMSALTDLRGLEEFSKHWDKAQEDLCNDIEMELNKLGLSTNNLGDEDPFAFELARWVKSRIEEAKEAQ